MIKHPGEVLSEEFLLPQKIKTIELARKLHVPVSTVQELIDGKQGITHQLASKLAKEFITTKRFWFKLQDAYNRSQE